MWNSNLDDVTVGPALVWFIVLGVFEKHFVHVGRGILEQFVCAVEDDEGDFAVAQDAQFVCLLHEAEFPFGESHLNPSAE